MTDSDTSPHQPEPDEIAKAVVLSSLAYLDNQEAMAAVETRYSGIDFERITMAQHFIVGFDPNESDCNTTLYVAFRRRLSIQDMFAVKVAGRNEFIESYGEAAEDVEGLYHSGLFEKITSELPRMSHFQHYHAKRIIFSGHGLAGALAHLFLICYMIKTQEEDREHISIGFGSPYFCDHDAKRFCQNTMELDRRMFTFVNATDPVPRILAGIEMTCNPESLGRRAECCCLERLNTWLGSGNSDERMEITSSSELKPVQSILKEMRIGRLNMPCYVSVGEYCNGRGSTLFQPESRHINIHKLMSIIKQQVSSFFSGNRVLDVNSWQCHRVESYVEGFAPDIASNPCIDVCPLSKPQMDIAPNPCTDVCTLSVYYSETGYEGVITIEGSDLSDVCSSKPIVEPNVGHDWMVEDASGSSVLSKGILTKLEADAIHIWKKDEIVEQTHLSVQLRTCFGTTLAKVLHIEDLWKDGSVASALTRVMGRLLLMQQSGDLERSEKYREAFETLEKGFREILENGFPGPLDRLSYSIHETKRKRFNIMKSFLTRPVEIPLQNNIIEQIDDGRSLIEPPELVRIKAGLYRSTSLSSDSELFSMIPGYACISKFCHESYFSISDRSIRILNYRDIVRTIYCLLSGTGLQGEQSDVSYYEKEIYNQVMREGQTVKTRQDLPEKLKEDIEKRASMMYVVITASKSLESLKFAVFIGPENAGKTTLINSILGENVGGVGFTTHTTVATPYRFKDDIYLVDFPGTDGGGDRAQLSKIWEEYEKVADLCVVVLNFGGDTSRAAQVFPRIAQSRMCGNVVLIINRVDSVLNGSRKSPVWAEYSAEKVQQLKISIAENSGLPADRVFLSVSRTNEELEETTRQLLKERLIMLKDEITSTVSRFLSELM